MYRFAKVTIYFGFAFIVTIFDIFRLIIDDQVDHRPSETIGHLNVIVLNFASDRVTKITGPEHRIRSNYSNCP